MTIDEALSYYGHKQTNICKAIGVSKNSVSRWYTNNSIPYDKQCQIQVATNGKLKARLLDDKYERNRKQYTEALSSDK